MATREVVVTVCDRCTTEVTTPLNRKNKKHSELVLPQGWLRVAGNTATALVFEMDLCDECKQIVIEAAGMARTVHSTTSKAKAKRADARRDAVANKTDAQPDSGVSQADVPQVDKTLASVG